MTGDKPGYSGIAHTGSNRCSCIDRKEHRMPTNREQYERNQLLHGAVSAGLARIQEGWEPTLPRRRKRKPRYTQPERMLYRRLQELGLEFIAQHNVPPYTVDAFLPALSLAIEVDGVYWHARHEERDARRDAYILEKGIRTVRIPIGDAGWEMSAQQLATQIGV